MSVWFELLIGLSVLCFGADRLVEGASQLARKWGVSAVVIGLTIVSYGTSAPEMAVSALASLQGKPDLAVSNVVGSNIFNVLFILGICALMQPLTVHSRLVRVDLILMLGVSLLAWALTADGTLSFAEAALLFGGMIGYTAFTLKKSKAEPAEVQREFKEALPAKKPGSVPVLILRIAVALGLLVLGTQWFVGGAAGLARALGVGDTIIGLTIVAAGTSMPEVFTSIVATMKGERDIAIGNVVGSNIFNILGILGVSGMLAGLNGLAVDPSLLGFDLPIMCAVAAACLPIFWSGGRISRGEGAVFFVYYLVYVIYLALNALEHPALIGFNWTVVAFVAPITLWIVWTGVLSHLRENRV